MADDSKKLSKQSLKRGESTKPLIEDSQAKDFDLKQYAEEGLKRMLASLNAAAGKKS
jgi:hypothetical protein